MRRPSSRSLSSAAALFLSFSALFAGDDVLTEILKSEATVASFDPTLRIGIVQDVDTLKIDGDARMLNGNGNDIGVIQGECRVVSAAGGMVAVCGKAYPAPLIFAPKFGFMSVEGRLFRGKVELALSGKGLTAVNVLHIEEYVRGVINKEIMPGWHIEAKKAQAVLARTYAVHKKVMRPRSALYDLDPTVLDQVYGGLDKEDLTANKAVAETRGEVLVYNNMPAEIYFHSTCGGRTASAKEVWGAEVPYLVPVKCDYCKNSSLYRWTRVLDADEVSKKLAAAGHAVGNLKKITVEKGDLRVAAVIVNGRRIEVNQFRKAVGFTVIYSNDFTVSLSGGKLTFSGKGFGHGVGACQYGMAGMAQSGKNWREILRHYLPGAEIRKMY